MLPTEYTNYIITQRAIPLQQGTQAVYPIRLIQPVTGFFIRALKVILLPWRAGMNIFLPEDNLISGSSEALTQV